MKLNEIYRNETKSTETKRNPRKQKRNEIKTKRNLTKRNYQNIFEIIKGITFHEANIFPKLQIKKLIKTIQFSMISLFFKIFWISPPPLLTMLRAWIVHNLI